MTDIRFAFEALQHDHDAKTFGFATEGPSLTRQEFAEERDINVLMAYGRCLRPALYSSLRSSPSHPTGVSALRVTIAIANARFAHKQWGLRWSIAKSRRLFAMNRPPAAVFWQALLEDPPHDPNCILSQIAASTESLLAWKLGPGNHRRKRPELAHQSGLDMIFIFPGPRQQFIETVDGMPVDHAREHIAQVSVGFDAVEFAGFDQRTDDRPPVTATVASGKEMVLAPERYCPFILPMSGRSWKSTTGIIHISAARSWCVAWSSERRANFLACKGR